MKLYHGTSAKFLANILNRGLQPRGRKKGQWDGEVASQSDCVYLTDSVAPFYAEHTTTGEGTDTKWMIVEVDTAKLDESKACADEDAILLYLEHKGELSKDNRNNNARKMAKDLSRINRWDDSLTLLGTCAYKGTIPPTAITRISVCDTEKMDVQLRFGMSDQDINLMAHRFLIDRRKAAMRWLFKEKVSPEEYYGDIWELNKKQFPDACAKFEKQFVEHVGVTVFNIINGSIAIGGEAA